MVLLDATIVNVALKSIDDGLHASAESLEWVLSGYALSFGLLLVPGGRLGDVRGRKQLFIIALFIFVVASALCGLAPNAISLVLARVAQGLGGGLLTPQVSGLIQQMFQGRERATAFAMFGAVVGVASALGPPIGGVLIALFGNDDGWRAVFLVNVPIGLATLVLAVKLLPGQARGHVEDRRYDAIGVLLLGSSIVLLLLPIIESRSSGLAIWACLPVALLLWGTFAWWERRQTARNAEPMVQLSLFTRPSYATGLILAACYFAGLIPLFFMLTLLLQSGLHYSALAAGITSGPYAIGSALSSAVAGRFSERLTRPSVALGLILMIAGNIGVLIAVQFFVGPLVGFALIVPLLVGGIGSGLVIALLQTITLSQVPVSMGGTASGVQQVAQRMGTAIGVAIAGAVFFGRVVEGQPGSPDYLPALNAGVFVANAFLLVSFCVALVDIRMHRLRKAQPAAA